MSQRENSRTPDLAELIRMAIKQNQAEVHVSLPGKIHKYDVAEQKADIDIMLQRPLVATDGTELEPETIPQLMDVPIEFPRGGGGTGDFFISWPLKPGDLVSVYFVERSLDQWLDKSGELTLPLDFRMHNLSDAVARPGLYPRKLSLASAHAENMVLGSDTGSQIHIKPSGEIHLASENAAEFIALAQKVLTELQNLNTHLAAVEAIITGTPINEPGLGAPSALQAALAVAIGASPLPTPQSVASSKVKAD
jgi:hypothetical protein